MLQTYIRAKLNTIYNQNEKIFTYKALVVVALKKIFRSGKLLRLFLRIQDSVRALSFAQGISIHKVARAHPRSESYLASHRG